MLHPSPVTASSPSEGGRPGGFGQADWEKESDALARRRAAAGRAVEDFACQRPVTAMGLLADGTTRTVPIRCGNRRASECPSCSKLYRGDASRLIRTGALDMDPSAVFVFVTLTAPSFGTVHHVPKAGTKARPGERRSPRRCRCGAHHLVGDSLRGVPVDMRTYDYDRQTLFNLHSGRLWHTTLQRWSRLLGERPDYLVVREWQARGAIHFHCLLRLPCAPADADALCGDLRAAATAVRSNVVDHSTGEAVALSWGSQVDVRLVDPTRRGRSHARVVAGYLGKLTTYAAKDLGADLPKTEETAPARLHHRLAEGAAMDLRCSSVCSGGRSCTGRAHKSWGFRGHVLTQSRPGRGRDAVPARPHSGPVRWTKGRPGVPARPCKRRWTRPRPAVPARPGWSGLTFRELRAVRREHTQAAASSESLEVVRWVVVGQEHKEDAARVRRMLLDAGDAPPPWFPGQGQPDA
ncbi:replication initiator [Embleya sp. NBC_00888]|uniref:replication initiator n=1 Tax=Embleya sp. NBC_00888 TaxID=2975960 RepID=UPI00386C3EF1